MNLREQLLKEHSKANCERILKWIGSDQQRFNDLLQLFLHDEYRVVQRAAWPLGCAVINHPPLVKKHFARLIKNLKKPAIHDAVKRNTVRFLQQIQIPEKFHGEVMDTCFRYIASPDEAVAIKAFSLTILENLSHQYPEIRNELKLVIEERWDYESAAFRSRAKKILKKT
ncbi:MAG: hypothetical protein JWM28_4265 [Chitinophagaceae bacterium]|nr:hypothetical protein [Chitinophagaceae bacterium]